MTDDVYKDTPCACFGTASPGSEGHFHGHCANCGGLIPKIIARDRLEGVTCAACHQAAQGLQGDLRCVNGHAHFHGADWTATNSICEAAQAHGVILSQLRERLRVHLSEVLPSIGDHAENCSCEWCNSEWRAAEITRLREALKFYADAEAWKDFYYEGWDDSLLNEDRGAIARKALGMKP